MGFQKCFFRIIPGRNKITLKRRSETLLPYHQRIAEGGRASARASAKRCEDGSPLPRNASDDTSTSEVSFEHRDTNITTLNQLTPQAMSRLQGMTPTSQLLRKLIVKVLNRVPFTPDPNGTRLSNFFGFIALVFSSDRFFKQVPRLC